MKQGCNIPSTKLANGQPKKTLSNGLNGAHKVNGVCTAESVTARKVQQVKQNQIEIVKSSSSSENSVNKAGEKITFPPLNLSSSFEYFSQVRELIE
jgi:hypothetical protein